MAIDRGVVEFNRWLCRKHRVQPVILDTALYDADRSDLLRPSRNITTNRRSLPTSFKLFTGEQIYALNYHDSALL